MSFSFWPCAFFPSLLAAQDLAAQEKTGQDLSGQDLSGQDFSGKYLSCKDLSCKDLSGQDLSGRLRPLFLERGFDRLEAILTEEQAPALASRDHDRMRQVSRRIVASTDPRILSAMKAWVTASPRSALARSEMAEVQLWRGWAIAWPLYGAPPGPMDAALADLLIAAQEAAMNAHLLDPALARPVQILQDLWHDGMRDVDAQAIFAEFAKQT